MKNFLLSLLGLILMVGMVHAQNDTMYIMKQGAPIGKIRLSEIDTIVFYNPVPIPENIDIANSTFLEMATNAANYIGGHSNKIPTIISDNSGTIKVNTADFYYMMARWLRYYNTYSDAPKVVGIIRGTGAPDNPSYSGGSLDPTLDQIKVAGYNTANYIDTNGKVPNYTTVGGVYIDASDLFYIFARAIRWYAEHGSLPAQGASYYQTIPPDTWTSN